MQVHGDEISDHRTNTTEGGQRGGFTQARGPQTGQGLDNLPAVSRTQPCEEIAGVIGRTR